MGKHTVYDLETDDAYPDEHQRDIQIKFGNAVFYNGDTWDEPIEDMLKYSTEHPTVLFILTTKEPYCIPSVIYIKDGKSYESTVTVTIAAFNPTFLA